MDLINHGAQGFLSHYYISNLFVNTEVSVLLGATGLILGIIPDVIGEYKARVKKDNYEWYSKIHNGLIWKWYKFTIPGFLHYWEDKFTHTPGYRWYAGIDYDITGEDAKFWEYLCPWRWRERMWVQSFSWAIILTLIINLYETIFY